MQKHFYFKNPKRLIGVILAVAIFIFNFTPSMQSIRALPNAIYVDDESELADFISVGTSLSFETAEFASLTSDELFSEKYLEVKLFGLLPIKKVPVYVAERKYVKPAGDAIGISIHTHGVLVVGNGTLIDVYGRKCRPSEQAGIKSGDIIISVNGINVNSSSDMQQIINKSQSSVELTIERESKIIVITVTPIIADDGQLKIGTWIRDSTVGIGTLSFINEKDEICAALGHAIIDSDTNSIIKVGYGEMRRATIVGVKKGLPGYPGELLGNFTSAAELIGNIEFNGEFGIYGKVNSENYFFESRETMPVAFPDEAKKGDAVILSTIDGDNVEAYNCKIIKLTNQTEPTSKGMVIEITDNRLLEKTGGIVQGMSGSPIIQNGMLVGVITHVFINDPSKGYAIYAYWMQNT